MQYSWLEKLTKEGHVREEVRDQIYRDCGLLLDKLAAPAAAYDAAADVAKIKGYLKQMAGDAVRMIPAMGGLMLGSAVYSKVRNMQDVSAIIKNKAAIMSSPEAAPYKEKASARFDELVNYAPRVATMPELSKKLVLQALHSGFTENDIRYLTSMQASYSRDVKDTQGLLASYQKKMSKSASDHSRELCGENLADVLCIVKEAASGSGAFQRIKNWGKAGKHILGTIAALTGAHLVVGLGSGAVNMARNAIDKKKMEAELKKSFEEAMKQSDPTREPLHANKEKARQAFQTLTHFAPHMAAEPSSARAFMNAMVSHDLGTPIGSVKELSEIERNIRGIKGSNPFFEGLAAGLETSGFGKSLGPAVQSAVDPVVEINKRHVAHDLFNLDIPAKKRDYA